MCIAVNRLEMPQLHVDDIIITVHDLNHVYAKKGLSLWWQNLRLTRHLRRAHQLVAITQFVADDIRRCLPWAPPAVVIHNGAADLTQHAQTPVPELVGQSYLLHISRMSASKNVGALIDDNALLAAQIADPDLVVRTGGNIPSEHSMVWETRQTSLYFTDTPWPDFDTQALARALEWFAQDDRPSGIQVGTQS